MSMLIAPIQSKGGGDGRQIEKGEKTLEQVNPGGNHGRGMEQGAHRRRPLHGVRQPGHQRKLCALADDAPKNEQGRNIEQGRGHARGNFGAVHVQNIEIAEMHQNHEDPIKKATSPARVMTKAFLPAWLALNFSYQKPIRK